MTDFHAKVSGQALISKRFPLHVTVEAWEPWGSETEPFPGEVTLELLVIEREPGALAKSFVTFTGELRRVQDFVEPFFVPDVSPPTAGGDPGPNAVWVQFNRVQEDLPFGPFPVPLAFDHDTFQIVLRITAPNHQLEAQFKTFQRTKEWILKVEPLSQQSSPDTRDPWPSAKRWPLGQQIRDVYHGGAEWPDRDWGKVLANSRKGTNWKKDGTKVGFSIGTSGCSYMVTTMLLRYLRIPDPEAPTTLATVFDVKVGRLFAAADRATDDYWPRKSEKRFLKNEQAGSTGSTVKSSKSLSIDTFAPKVPADVAAEYFPAQLVWLVMSRGKDAKFTPKRVTYTGGEAKSDQTVEWFMPGKTLSSNGWSDKWGLVPPPWSKELSAHFDLVPWEEPSGVKKVRKIRDALNDGLPVIGLFGGGDHWCMIVGYRTLDKGQLQFVINDPGGWKYTQYSSPVAGIPTTRGGKKLGTTVILHPRDWESSRAQILTATWDVPKPVIPKKDEDDVD